MPVLTTWTVARFPSGYWTTGGRPSCYEGAEVFQVQAFTRDEAKKKAQAQRSQNRRAAAQKGKP